MKKASTLTRSIKRTKPETELSNNKKTHKVYDESQQSSFREMHTDSTRYENLSTLLKIFI